MSKSAWIDISEGRDSKWLDFFIEGWYPRVVKSPYITIRHPDINKRMGECEMAEFIFMENPTPQLNYETLCDIVKAKEVF